MKKIIFLLLIAGLFSSRQANGQCACFELFTAQNSNNPCRMDVTVQRTANCNAGGSLRIISYELLFGSSVVSDATSVDTSIVVTIDGDKLGLTFRTNFDLAALPLNEPRSIGSFFVESNDNITWHQGSIAGDPPLGVFCTFAPNGYDVNCLLSPPSTFYKLYGNGDENYPNKVKGFNTYTYLLASRKTPNGEYATFSKFTSAGALVWEYQLDFTSSLFDFELADKLENSFMLVGRTEPFQITGVGPQDNKSLLVKIKDNGSTASLIFCKKFAHTGREHFTRIIKHPAPLATPLGTFPFYVVGAKNPDNTPAASSTDQLMVYAFDLAGNIGWNRQYNYQYELESHRLLFPTADGHIVVGGDGGPVNDGILIKINGANGNVLSGNTYSGASIDFYDGMELSNGEIVVAGGDFGNNNGILVRFSSSFAPINGTAYTNLGEFHEMGIDNQGRFYALGQEKTTGNQYPIVMRTSAAFNPVYSAYYADGELDFKEQRFSVTPSAQRIYYADSRQISVSPVNYDMLVGSFDLNFTNPNATNNCRNLYQVTTAPFLPVRTGIQVTPVPLSQNIDPTGQLIPVTLPCSQFCPPSTCTAGFMWAIGRCLDVQFVGSGTTNGSGPLQYAWDFDGGGTDATGATATWVFPGPGSYNVCLTVTDPSNNCSVTNCQLVVVPPASVPTCSVPANIVANTDPNLCSAFLSPVVSGTGCPLVTISATLSGSIGSFFGPGPLALSANYPKGVTTATVVVTDAFNQSATCSFTVTVIDNEPPKITCPQNQFVTAPACNGGAVVNFPAPVVTDNCPMASYTCTQNSGNYFPCGQTIVSCVATDMSQHTSSCLFSVNVDCQCAQIGTATITCDPTVDDKYLFSIPVSSLSNAIACTADVVGTGQAGVTVMSSGPMSVYPSGILTGMITVSGPIPGTFNLMVNVQCTCGSGQIIQCSLPVVLTPICCKHISINSQSVCSTDQQLLVNLNGCSQFQQIQQVNWWVATGPTCPPYPGVGWTSPQGSFDCSPLLLFPYLYTDNIWVVVEMTVGDSPCHLVTSNIAQITLCKPVSCDITPSFQEYCYTGMPVTPTGLMVLPHGNNCPVFGYEWSGPGVPSGQTGANYQPGGLSTSNTTDCFEDFVFYAKVKSLCGDQTCSATVRLYNDAASIGVLDMVPDETMPFFCPGEDATMAFDPKCASHPPDPAMWKWCVSTLSSTAGFSPIIGSGTMNPLWNTNQLYVDHWYKVKATNGVCNEKEEVFYIDVMDPLAAGPLTITPVLNLPDCDVQGLDLSVPFSPTPADPTCPIKVTWFHNGNVIGVQNYFSSPATITYNNPGLLGDYSGNYWAVVERPCCREKVTTALETMTPPCYLELTGPCYLMEGDTATLSGQVINPMNGVICNSQWYFTLPDGTLSAVATSNVNTITVTMAGVYVYEVTCDNGCTKRADFSLDLCHNDCTNLLKELPGGGFSARIQPNPNPGVFTVELSDPAPEGMQFRILSTTGQLWFEQAAGAGARAHTLEVEALPGGMYYLQIVLEGKVLAVKKFVRAE